MRLTILSFLAFSTVGLAQDTIKTSDNMRKGDKVFDNNNLFTGIAIEKAENGQLVLY